MTESEIQKRVLDALKGRSMPGVVYWHTPHNRSSRRFSGYRAGVSDISLVLRGRYHAVELKREDGVASPEQLQFLADINAAGGLGIVAQGLEQALYILEAWGILRKESA